MFRFYFCMLTSFKMLHRLLLLCTLILFFGCQKKGCQVPDKIKNIAVSVQIERLEKPFFSIQTKSDVVRFLDDNPTFSHHFLRREAYPSDSVLVGSLFSLARDTSVRTLVRETNQRFEKIDDLEQDLELAFKHVRHYFPGFQVPQVKTYISGLGQDLFVNDSLMVLGLDFFVGPSASYLPQVPAYVQRRYQKEYIVPSAMLLVSNKFNETNMLNKSMLAEMIYYGKAYYFVEQMMPCTPDSLIIGYTDQQIADVNYNEAKVWAHFVEKGLLYENNHFQVSKYIGERPSIPEISNNAPGRIGAWVGWQIVRKYMQEHPEVTLAQLMAEPDPQKIFTQSRYKPKRR
jgi:gliding motility-associated lipoprotein GldB